jgi:hypothetical protein
MELVTVVRTVGANLSDNVVNLIEQLKASGCISTPHRRQRNGDTRMRVFVDRHV